MPKNPKPEVTAAILTYGQALRMLEFATDILVAKGLTRAALADILRASAAIIETPEKKKE